MINHSTCPVSDQNRKAGKSSDAVVDIHSRQTIMDIYPHTGTFFHRVMALLALALISPAMIFFFPVFVGLKLLISLLVHYPLSRLLMKNKPFDVLKLKNRILFPLHYLIYKIVYVHVGIWLSGFKLFKLDEYWYGLDLSKYQGLDGYMNAFANSKIRWKYRKNLKLYQDQKINKYMIPDHLCFFKLLFSFKVFKLMIESNYRKNIQYSMSAVLFFLIRGYYLMLFLPLRVFVYEKDGKIAGIVTYLKRGNTLIMCQSIIGNQYTGSALFYDQVEYMFQYGFHDPDIRYLSLAATAQKSKKACGFVPINFLLTDEFRPIPFSPMNLHEPSKENPVSGRFFAEEIKSV